MLHCRISALLMAGGVILSIGIMGLIWGKAMRLKSVEEEAAAV